MGATHLARKVGCSQSLISSLERTDAEKSKLNNKFAEVLHVDPSWLAFGIEGKAPAGWDEVAARRGREQFVRRGDRGNVVRMPLGAESNLPAWSEDSGVPLGPISRPDALAKEIVDRYWALAREDANTARTLLTTLRHIADLIAGEQGGEETRGDKQ